MSRLSEALTAELANARAELAALSRDSRARVRLMGRVDGLQRALDLAAFADRGGGR